MSTSAIKLEPRAVDVHVTEDALEVRLADGRELRVPLAWFPTLQAAPAAARQDWRLIGGGIGIHWAALDEDLSVAGLLAS